MVSNGRGEAIESEPDEVARSLRALAVAAVRFGGVVLVRWLVVGRQLVLTPVDDAEARVIAGDELRDLGSLVARLVLEALGGSLELADGSLHVRL